MKMIDCVRKNSLFRFYRIGFFLTLLLLISFFCLSSDLNAESKDKQQILVLGIKAKDLDRSVLGSLIALIAEEINNSGYYKAITSSEISDILSIESQKQMLGCDDQKCLVEIAGAMGASRVISGTLVKLEGSYLVNLQILNTDRVIVEARVSYDWRGDARELTDLVRVAAQSLILSHAMQRPSALMISRAPENAKILIDGKNAGNHPRPLKNINLGPHKLVLQLDGYEDFETYFLAKNGETTVVDAPMIAIKKSFYETWWFWGALSLVTAGTILAINLAKEDDSNPAVKVDAELPAPADLPGEN